MFESLEPRCVLSGVPYGAMPNDTAEFMLGDVLVNVVLFESDGSIDLNLEDWTEQAKNEVKATVAEGLTFWEDLLDAQGSVHELNFQLDFTYLDNPVQTGFEPILRSSNDYYLWVDNFLDQAGFQTSGDLSEDILAFNHAERVAHGTDWAFTIFVANASNDADGSFGVGGFSQAFAFAGGRFLVMPSGRPASTVAHEAAHIFYAFDEYPGAKSYYDTRGYYNTQNLNAWTGNPNPSERVLSLLDNDLELAFAQYAVSQSALEMMGWRDSDGNGVFDVLDVPHQLSGSGRYDESAGSYHFVGQASVSTLPNLNPAGLGNDITLNEVSRVQFRVDDGPWQDALEVHAYEVDLDFTLALAPGWTSLEIRVVDDATGVSSASFRGLPDQATSINQAGLQGFLFEDQNDNGHWDADEVPLSGWTVTALDDAGLPLPDRGVEPDDHATGTVLNSVTPGVTLTFVGNGVIANSVVSRPRDTASTGTNVFGHLISQGWSAAWTSDSRQLRMDFTSPVSAVRLDAIANSEGDFGRLEIFDAQGNLLARYTTGPLATGEVETMTLLRPTADIAYAIARGHNGTAVLFDQLKFDPPSQTLTNDQGAFALPSLPDGTYQVTVTPPSGTVATLPSVVQVSYVPGEAMPDVDVGAPPVVPSPVWHNTNSAVDVDASGVVDTVDALLVIHELLSNGARSLPTDGNTDGNRYFDVNNDQNLSVIDALLVIHWLLNGSSSPSGASEPDLRTWETTNVSPSSISDTVAEPTTAQAFAEPQGEAEPQVSSIAWTVHLSDTRSSEPLLMRRAILADDEPSISRRPVELGGSHTVATQETPSRQTFVGRSTVRPPAGSSSIDAAFALHEEEQWLEDPLAELGL